MCGNCSGSGLECIICESSEDTDKIVKDFYKNDSEEVIMKRKLEAIEDACVTLNATSPMKVIRIAGVINVTLSHDDVIELRKKILTRTENNRNYN